MTVRPPRKLSRRADSHALGLPRIMPRTEFFFDCLDEAQGGWLGLGRKHGRDMPIAPDEILVEIPARGLERPLGRGPFVERVRIRSLDVGLGGEREADAVTLMRSESKR